MSSHHNKCSNQNSFSLQGCVIIFSIALTLSLPLCVLCNLLHCFLPFSTIFPAAFCCLTVSCFYSPTTKIDPGQKYSPGLKNVSAFDLLVADSSCLAYLLQSGELGEAIGVTLLRFSAILAQVICCRLDLWPSGERASSTQNNLQGPSETCLLTLMNGIQ